MLTELNHFFQNKGIFLPYAFLACAILSIMGRRQISLKVWGGLLSIAILTGLYFQRILPIGLIPIAITTALFYGAFRFKNRSLAIVCGILGGAFALGLAFHVVPGFQNLQVLHQVRLTEDAVPYSLYLNFDKGMAGLLILGFGYSYINHNVPFTGRTLRETLIIAFCLLILIMILALTTQYVKFEPKWNNIFYLWAFENLIFTCVAEEAFFRGLIQNSLTRITASLHFGKPLALIVASILFGMAHFRGGILYMGLAGVAGLFYGFAYMRTQRIESGIIVHFLLNMMHFLFFTYPALSR